MLKMQTIILLSVLLAALCLKVNAHPWYQTYIPNGAIVPNPCNRSTIWPGVGHQAVYGAGPRNPFGLDFAANNHTWNSTLCMMDSDGDGRTNGQELGDPNCTWMMGSNPAYSTNITHPGVCEPLTSTLCMAKNSWMTSCTGMPAQMNCPAISGPDVTNFTLRFPVTPIPAQETTYICHHFTLPNDSVSDIIAFQPVVDNAAILHHMLIYACVNNPTDSPANSSYLCGMGGGMSCMSLIGAWTVGVTGSCLNSQLGFRIGPGGFQYAILQLHWNNPMLTAGMTDSSGMLIYRTTTLRPNRGQIAMIGPIFLVIPPNQPQVTITGSCVSMCTQQMQKNSSIYLTSAFLHMHTLGKSGYILQKRNGNVLQVLDNVTSYDYNAPTQISFDTPIELKPGDEIQVTCVYSSIGRNWTTLYGEDTSSEMCFGFTAYYPLIEGLGYCGQFGGIDLCNNSYIPVFKPCDFVTFSGLIIYVNNSCSANCQSKACGVIMNGIQATGCLSYPEVLGFIYAFYPSVFFQVYTQCAPQWPPPTTTTTTTQTMIGSHASGQGISSYLAFIITLLAYAVHESIWLRLYH